MKQKLVLNHFNQYFSSKYAKSPADILLIKNIFLLGSRKVANAFNNYSQSIIKNLDLFEWLDEPKFNICYEIDIIINKFWSQSFL